MKHFLLISIRHLKQLLLNFVLDSLNHEILLFVSVFTHKHFKWLVLWLILKQTYLVLLVYKHCLVCLLVIVTLDTLVNSRPTIWMHYLIYNFKISINSHLPYHKCTKSPNWFHHYHYTLNADLHMTLKNLDTSSQIPTQK